MALMSNYPSRPAPHKQPEPTSNKLMHKTCLILLFLAAWFSGTVRAEVNIVTTIKPLQLIAEAVIQKQGSVSSIMDPRQSPHHFTLSPSDRIALAQADIAIWIGPLFETHLTDFIAQQKLAEKTLTVIETPGLTLHAISASQLDAHLWLDSSNAVRIAGIIADRAASLDPQNEAVFRRNLSLFEADIERLNIALRQKLSIRSTAKYAVYHNAYQYFEKQFGLQYAMVILQDAALQPGIREIVQLRQQVQQLSPSCLLLEIDANADLVSTVLNGHQLKSITVDLLGIRTNINPGGYSQFLLNLADDFISCLHD